MWETLGVLLTGVFFPTSHGKGATTGWGWGTVKRLVGLYMNVLRGKSVANYSHEFLKVASELNKTIAVLDCPHSLIEVTMKKLL